MLWDLIFCISLTTSFLTKLISLVKFFTVLLFLNLSNIFSNAVVIYYILESMSSNLTVFTVSFLFFMLFYFVCKIMLKNQIKYEDKGINSILHVF